MLIFVLIIYKPFSRGAPVLPSFACSPLYPSSGNLFVGQLPASTTSFCTSFILKYAVFSRQKLKISTEIYLPLLLVLYLVFFAVYLLSLFIHKYKCICIIFHFMIIEYFVTTLRMWNIFRLFFCQIFAVRRNVFIFLSKVEFLVESLENVEQK